MGEGLHGDGALRGAVAALLHRAPDSSRHDRASEFDSWDCVDELVDAEDFSQEWGEAAAR